MKRLRRHLPHQHGCFHLRSSCSLECCTITNDGLPTITCVLQMYFGDIEGETFSWIHSFYGAFSEADQRKSISDQRKGKSRFPGGDFSIMSGGEGCDRLEDVSFIFTWLYHIKLQSQDDSVDHINTAIRTQWPFPPYIPSKWYYTSEMIH